MAGLLALLLLAGCSSATVGHGQHGPVDAGRSTRPRPAPEDSGTRAGCPRTALEPAADRPVIDVQFSLDDAGTVVTGVETVRFSPDVPTDEMVFRLTANQPLSADAGSSIEVGAVRGADIQTVRYETAGARAGTQGGLLVLGLASVLQPGDGTQVVIEFTLTLGTGSFDRFGRDDESSWWGSGHPLLAWETGVGWARDRLVGILGETATSPAARTSVTVLAAADRTVVMTGGASRVGLDADGRMRWYAESPAARDVSVSVGRYVVLARQVGPTQVVVAAATPVVADQVMSDLSTAVADLVGYLGPFPFESLSVARLADYGGGVEYPGMILLASPDAGVLVHEVAHMWFYGMVGDDQGRDPWLDEAFASYAQGLGHQAPDIGPEQITAGRGVGLPVSAFGSATEYFSTVYGKGATMLAAARAAAGAPAFDAALRCYLNANAWRIATPADVRAAFADLPAVLDVLVRAGALPA